MQAPRPSSLSSSALPSSRREGWALLILIGLVTGKVALHLLTAVGYGAHRDEFLYADYGRHLAWGYKEAPPLLGWLAALSHWAAPGSLVALRIWPALFGGLTVALTCLIVKTLKGGAWATLLAGLAVSVAPIYLVMHHLFQPNFLDVFTWTLATYTTVRFLTTPTPRWIWATGAAIGLGLLSKYSMAFYAAGLVGALLLTPQRRQLLTRATGGAALLAGALLLPNLLWQVRHDWPLVGHMEKLRESQLGNVRMTDFLFDQIGMTAPGAVLWLTGLVFLFSAAGRKWRALGWHFLLVMGLLMLTHGKNYYAAGLYPPLIAVGAVALERIFERVRRPFGLVGGLVVLALVPLGVRAVFPVLVPIWPASRLAAYVSDLVKRRPMFEGIVRWEDGNLHPLPQDVADMHGWPEYAPLAAKALARLPVAVRSHCLLIGDNYGPAGACNWYGAALGLPEAYSTNGSYSLWWPPNLNSTQAVVYLQEGDERPELADWFEQTELIGTVQDPLARIHGSGVWLMRRPKPGLAEFVRKEVAEAKAGFEG